MGNTSNTTVAAEILDPVTESPEDPVVTTDDADAARRGRKATGERSRARMSMAGSRSAVSRARTPGTAAPVEAAGTQTIEPSDAAGDHSGGSVRERVWAVLLTHPGRTPAELATAAQVGRSTVSKLLASWAREGTATSTPEATGRAARRWTATPSSTTAAQLCQTDDVGSAGTHENTARSTGGTHRQARGQNPHLTDAGTTGEAPAVRSPANPNCLRRGPVTGTRADDTTLGSPADVGAAAGSAGIGLGLPRSQPRGSTRLAAGQLRSMVEEFLAEHPGSHGPVEIGHALVRSLGAVANGLEHLVETGKAERTSERPKRYAFADADPGPPDDPAAGNPAADRPPMA